MKLSLVLPTLLVQLSSAIVQPIILVPGLGGSVLEARLSGRSPYRDCQTTADWYTVWFSESQVAFRFACWLDTVTLVDGDPSPLINASNASGVDIRARDFGGVDGVEYSNSGAGDLIPMPYMYNLIKALEEVGYERGKTLRAATYDFRTAGINSTLQWQYNRLKGLVENTHDQNNGQRVHLLSHSLGGPYLNLFLAVHVSEEWKAMYIESHMMFSPPLAGTPVALEALVIGPQCDFVPSFLPKSVVPALRTFPVMMWMSPLASVTGAAAVWKDRVLISTPAKNYTTSNYHELFKAMNSTSFGDTSILDASFDEVSKTTTATADSAGVRVFCAYVNDTKTTTSYAMDSALTQEISQLEQTYGDGTVPLASLELCHQWASKVSIYQFGGSLAAHTEILSYGLAITDIINWVGASITK